MTPEPHIVAAQGIVSRIEDAILFPLMTLLVSVALLVFMWGVFEYIRGGDSDTARAKGRMHMLYGVIGFVVMVSAYAILKIAAGTFGVSV